MPSSNRATSLVCIVWAALIASLAGCGNSEHEGHPVYLIPASTCQQWLAFDVGQHEGYVSGTIARTSLPAWVYEQHADPVRAAKYVEHELQSGCEKAKHEGRAGQVELKQVVPLAVGSASGGTASTAPATLPMPYTAILQLRSAQGYTAEMVLRRGSFTHAAGQQNGSVTAGTSCTVDTQTDAVAPFQLTLASTTKGFAASPGVDLLALTPPETLLPKLQAEASYSDGAQCITFQEDAQPGEEGGGYLGFSPSKPLSQGESTTSDGFLILPGYYSPAKPDGNTSSPDGILLELKPSFGSEAVRVTEHSGAFHTIGIPAAVPLLPGGSPGCLVYPPCDVPDPTAGVP